MTIFINPNSKEKISVFTGVISPRPRLTRLEPVRLSLSKKELAKKISSLLDEPISFRVGEDSAGGDGSIYVSRRARSEAVDGWISLGFRRIFFFSADQNDTIEEVLARLFGIVPGQRAGRR